LGPTIPNLSHHYWTRGTLHWGQWALGTVGFYQLIGGYSAQIGGSFPQIFFSLFSIGGWLGKLIGTRELCGGAPHFSLGKTPFKGTLGFLNLLGSGGLWTTTGFLGQHLIFFGGPQRFWVGETALGFMVRGGPFGTFSPRELALMLCQFPSRFQFGVGGP